MTVRTEDLDKALAEVIGTFDGVEEISAKQREGIVIYIPRKDILAVLPICYGKSLLLQLLPGVCRGIYDLPKESHYFSYLPVDAYLIAHEVVAAEKHFMCLCM